MKNPLLSMWLSGANSAAGAARGFWTAEMPVSQPCAPLCRRNGSGPGLADFFRRFEGARFFGAKERTASLITASRTGALPVGFRRGRVRHRPRFARQERVRTEPLTPPWAAPASSRCSARHSRTLIACQGAWSDNA